MQKSWEQPRLLPAQKPGQGRKVSHGAVCLNCPHLNSWTNKAGTHLPPWEGQSYIHTPELFHHLQMHPRCFWVPGLCYAPNHVWQQFERVLLGTGLKHDSSHATAQQCLLPHTPTLVHEVLQDTLASLELAKSILYILLCITLATIEYVAENNSLTPVNWRLLGGRDGIYSDWHLRLRVNSKKGAHLSVIRLFTGGCFHFIANNWHV